MKQHRDQTDFRAVRESFEHRALAACSARSARTAFIAQNSLAFAVRDEFPVTPLHTLVIPRRHEPSYFELGQAEINACTALMLEAREGIRQQDPTALAFMWGANDGVTAGQTVPHCHIHLIPRRQGDVSGPEGSSPRHPGDG